MEEAGLVVEYDAVGNLFASSSVRDPDGVEIWVGSHLDSVPDGGRYDGPLGILVALEAAMRVETRARLTVIVFRDEEGTRFGNGCLGSRSLVGPVGNDELQLRDADGVTLADALSALGLQLPERPWVRGRPHAFIEAVGFQYSDLASGGASFVVVDQTVETVVALDSACEET